MAIVEAVRGEGGVIPHRLAPPEWLAGLREITAGHDVPVVRPARCPRSGRRASSRNLDAVLAPAGSFEV